MPPVHYLCSLTFAVLMARAAVAADLCDVTYKVQPGDTAQSIAAFHYGDDARWSLIYYANQGLMQGQDVVPGSDIYIPCAAQAPSPAPSQDAADAMGAQPAALPANGADMVLLTGGNYAPFADKTWPGRGMATELVKAALENSPSPVTHALEWEDDWSRHLFPLLDERRFDMGFPWLKPDCDAVPDNALCAGFHFSDPLMELPIMLFAKAGSGVMYASDADIAGLRLCRPAGYFTHDLDRPDRQWLRKGMVTLIQPDSPEACFEALMAGEVEAVTLNIFLGASTVVSMGLRGKVQPIETPLSRETLHVIISKKHWRGTTHLYRINAGLAALRESGRYTDLVERHLEIFWDKLK